MPKRVLIADDSKFVREIIGEFLTDAGFTVCGEAETGVQAVEKSKALHPDLIVVDLSMPMMNGAEAVSVIKRAMPDIHVIIFTMYSDAVIRGLGSAVGADIVLSKPDGMTQLVDFARTIFGESEVAAPPTVTAKAATNKGPAAQ